LRVQVCRPLINTDEIIANGQNCFDTASNTTANAARTATFVFMGRLSTEKSVPYFMHAVNTLQYLLAHTNTGITNSSTIAVKGLVIGSGMQLESLKTLQKQLDLQDSIEFLGYKTPSETPCIIKGATALVLPSIYAESFGMAAPEAMLQQVPVITFGYGGSGDCSNTVSLNDVPFDNHVTLICEAVEVVQ
jgi:glycosyltransferase involved in cell wall biosynthesis